MCNRTACYGSVFGPLACVVCRERDMSEMKLTDAELARLEELAELYLSGKALPFAESDYRESSCNAVPSLVAEVRRLREDNEGLTSTMKTAIMCGRVIENENAALRERVEALERLVAAHDNYLTMADNIAEFGKTPENLENLQAAYDRRAAAREAIK